MDTLFLSQNGKPELAQGLLSSALEFYNAGSRCAASFSLTPNITSCPAGPMVVCYAFSLELYLKLLVLISQGKAAKKLHELGELFDAISPAVRADLARRCEAPEDQIAAALHEGGKAFVEWRYSFEQGGLRIDPRMLTHIIGAAHRLVRELRPDLKVTFESYTPPMPPPPTVTVTDDPEAAALAVLEQLTGHKLGRGPFGGFKPNQQD